MGDDLATGPKRVKQNHQMNRPVRLVSHGRHDSRSSSVTSSASGISKRKARSIRDLNVFRDRDLPEVANKVNDLWKLCNNAVKEAEIDSQHKVDKYRQKLQEKSQKLARYLETINVQAQAIQTLEHEKNNTDASVEKLKQQVRVYSQKVAELVDKCRSLKDTLDSTLEEHNHHKESFRDAIEEIRAEKQREQSARELVERQLAAVREHMKERVRQAEAQSQEECRRSKLRLRT
jgi:chromosome segregation ATPase